MTQEEKELVEQKYARGYARIDLDAVLHNMRHMKSGIDDKTKMIAVIKTDGYGHGSIPIADVLEAEEYVWGYAVAAPEEAFLLREHGIRKPILILGYTFPYAYERMALEQIRPAVFEREMAAKLAKAARKTGKAIKVHIKVDTGMGRIGIMPDDTGLAFVRELQRYTEEGSLEMEGIFTHFARADEREKQPARKQFALFTDFIRRIRSELGIQIPVKHCANSAGILELPESNLDAVRAGITLYGLHPSEEVPGGETYLRPVLSLHSHVVYVKTIHAGQSVSYGGTFTAKSDVRVATIPVGYGDGYPRSLSGGKGYVLIRGKKAPILGRVCMDQFMVDVTDIPEVTAGDPVTLIGRDGEREITVEQLGTLSGRFNYELVCDLSRRIPRVFVRDGALAGVQDLQGCKMQ
ncbi:MAG: alanine racemase [Lachnospiraceae bacterium]|nr:alanine racemase [Lachnospiraceae bacterium]